MSVNNTYAFKFLIALDMFACALIWRDSDVTISSMTGLEMRKSAPALWARALNGFLNLLQKGHCELAIASDLARAQAAQQLLTETPK